jgi:hypothetical protein
MTTEVDRGDATTKPNGTPLERQWDDREIRRRKWNDKTPRTLLMLLGPAGGFFPHFIFILLTKPFNCYLKLLMTMTEWPPHLACEPLAHRVDCKGDEMTGRREQRNREEEDNDMGRMKQWRKGHKMTGNGNNNEGTTPPGSSLMSNCLWGGSQVE